MADHEDYAEYEIGHDESYDATRSANHAPYVGIRAVTGVGDDEGESSYRETVATALKGEGLEAELYYAEWDVGRGASAVEIMVYSVTGVFALAKGVKALDEAIPIIRKWWRALRKARERLGDGQFTREALKLACVDDLVDRFGTENLPRYDLMSAATTSGQFFDGQWGNVGPHYFLIPDPARNITHLYVVKESGEILHRGELPCFLDDESTDMLLGPVCETSAVSEEAALVPRLQNWDRDRQSPDKRSDPK